MYCIQCKSQDLVGFKLTEFNSFFTRDGSTYFKYGIEVADPKNADSVICKGCNYTFGVYSLPEGTYILDNSTIMIPLKDDIDNRYILPLDIKY
jgi:hypothetical protein